MALVDWFKAASRNCAKTVLLPVPAESVQLLVAANGSQADQEFVLSLLNLMESIAPLSRFLLVPAPPLVRLFERRRRGRAGRIQNLIGEVGEAVVAKVGDVLVGE